MTIFTATLDTLQISDELNSHVQNAKWVQGELFNYRHYNHCVGIGSESFISSIQQYQFNNGALPAFAQSEDAFYATLNRLQPKTIFERSEEEAWVTLKIFNFYPAIVRFFAHLFGYSPHITAYLKHHSMEISYIRDHTPAPESVWGYEFFPKRGIPQIFLAGPTLFDFTIQFYKADLANNILSLTFIASERPQSLFNMLGKDRIFPNIWRIAESDNAFSPMASTFINYAENAMLDLHNRVHKELMMALCQID